MKKQMLSLLGLGLLLATASAYAQTVQVKADVPFSFIVDKQTLPAGEYTVQSMDLAGRALLIRNADQKALEMVLSIPCEKKAADDTKLVFRRYGSQYFLSQIWVAGNGTGHEIPKSHREAEVARDYTPQEVIVTASLR